MGSGGGVALVEGNGRGCARCLDGEVESAGRRGIGKRNIEGRRANGLKDGTKIFGCEPCGVFVCTNGHGVGFGALVQCEEIAFVRVGERDLDLLVVFGIAVAGDVNADGSLR